MDWIKLALAPTSVISARDGAQTSSAWQLVLRDCQHHRGKILCSNSDVNCQKLRVRAIQMVENTNHFTAWNYLRSKVSNSKTWGMHAETYVLIFRPQRPTVAQLGKLLIIIIILYRSPWCQRGATDVFPWLGCTKRHHCGSAQLRKHLLTDIYPARAQFF